MNKKELYNLIDSLVDDIEFEYRGIHGAICPFSRNKIIISYGDVEKEHTSIDNAMNDKIFNRNSLNDIADEIDL